MLKTQFLFKKVFYMFSVHTGIVFIVLLEILKLVLHYYAHIFSTKPQRHVFSYYTYCLLLILAWKFYNHKKSQCQNLHSMTLHSSQKKKNIYFLLITPIFVAFCSFFPCSLTVFHRGRQQKSSRADKQHCFP